VIRFRFSLLQRTNTENRTSKLIKYAARARDIMPMKEPNDEE